MIENRKIITEDIINRAKIYLNVSSDSKLSTILGKQENYISLVKSQKRKIDLYSLLENCAETDLNWLVFGNADKSRLIAELDDKTGRKIIDLNKDVEKVKEENEHLSEMIQFFKNIVKIKERYGSENSEKLPDNNQKEC